MMPPPPNMMETEKRGFWIFHLKQNLPAMLGLETEASKFAVSFLVVAFTAFFFLLLEFKDFLERSSLDGSGEFIFPIEILRESAHKPISSKPKEFDTKTSSKRQKKLLQFHPVATHSLLSPGKSPSGYQRRDSQHTIVQRYLEEQGWLHRRKRIVKKNRVRNPTIYIS